MFHWPGIVHHRLLGASVDHSSSSTDVAVDYPAHPEPGFCLSSLSCSMLSDAHSELQKQIVYNNSGALEYRDLLLPLGHPCIFSSKLRSQVYGFEAFSTIVVLVMVVFLHLRKIKYSASPVG